MTESTSNLMDREAFLRLPVDQRQALADLWKGGAENRTFPEVWRLEFVAQLAEVGALPEAELQRPAGSGPGCDTRSARPTAAVYSGEGVMVAQGWHERPAGDCGPAAERAGNTPRGSRGPAHRKDTTGETPGTGAPERRGTGRGVALDHGGRPQQTSHRGRRRDDRPGNRRGAAGGTTDGVCTGLGTERPGAVAGRGGGQRATGGAHAIRSERPVRCQTAIVFRDPGGMTRRRISRISEFGSCNL